MPLDPLIRLALKATARSEYLGAGDELPKPLIIGTLALLPPPGSPASTSGVLISAAF